MRAEWSRGKAWGQKQLKGGRRALGKFGPGIGCQSQKVPVRQERVQPVEGGGKPSERKNIVCLRRGRVPSLLWRRACLLSPISTESLSHFKRGRWGQTAGGNGSRRGISSLLPPPRFTLPCACGEESSVPGHLVHGDGGEGDEGGRQILRGHPGATPRGHSTTGLGGATASWQERGS